MTTYEYYDRSTSLTFPDGTSMTAAEMAESDFYRLLGTVDCAICRYPSGAVYFFQLLDELKMQYGVDEADPADAVAAINEKAAEMEEHAAQEAASLADVQAQLDALAGVSGQSV